MRRADDGATSTLFPEAVEAAAAARKVSMKPWWLATLNARRGLLTASVFLGLGAGLLTWSFFSPAWLLRILGVWWLVYAAWFAASALVVSRRVRLPGKAAKRSGYW